MFDALARLTPCAYELATPPDPCCPARPFPSRRPVCVCVLSCLCLCLCLFLFLLSGGALAVYSLFPTSSCLRPCRLGIGARTLRQTTGNKSGKVRYLSVQQCSTTAIAVSGACELPRGGMRWLSVLLSETGRASDYGRAIRGSRDGLLSFMVVVSLFSFLRTGVRSLLYGVCRFVPLHMLLSTAPCLVCQVIKDRADWTRSWEAGKRGGTAQMSEGHRPRGSGKKKGTGQKKEGKHGGWLASASRMDFLGFRFAGLEWRDVHSSEVWFWTVTVPE